MALHHDLLEQATHLATREIKKPKQASLRRAVSAAYHALFHLLVADGGGRLDPKLLAVIQAFVDLQEARHDADYNLDKQWNRLDVLNRVQTARQAFADWAAVRNTPNATVFIVALVLQKHWGR